MEEIKAIDVMNYPFTPTLQEEFWSGYEFDFMRKAIFKGKNPMMVCSAEEYVKEMDRIGYETVFISMPKVFSFRNKKVEPDFTPDEIYDSFKDYPDRFVGLAGYNPLRIKESLEEIEHAVRDLGFKGVYAHTYGYDITPDDRRMYPCYAKCVELEIPFSIQLGHSLELLPSKGGRPLLIDTVALEFPDLRLIGSHTGWPWCDEMIAMAWKHPNVYMDISAHLPRYLDESIKQFMTTRGKNKVLFGTNGIGLEACLSQFNEIPMNDEVRKKILRENATRLFGL
jgi:predicted TIM-barrel fold metal-dependent hydrolase